VNLASELIGFDPNSNAKLDDDSNKMELEDDDDDEDNDWMSDGGD
jgi:phage terminase small subunit